MSKKKRGVPHVKLDAYEQELEDALPESLNELPTTENLDDELAFAKEAAANYLRKGTKINIRLSHYDVEGLRRLAVREGLPYQTLIASILHKYVSRHLETKAE
jgi:predicted DNA binding CopG/RHH family protein